MQDATCALIDSSLFVRIRSFPTSPHSNAVSFALCVAVAFTDRGLSPPLRFVRFHVSPSSSIPLGITLTTHYLRSYMSVTAHHTKSCAYFLYTQPVSVYSLTQSSIFFLRSSMSCFSFSTKMSLSVSRSNDCIIVPTKLFNETPLKLGLIFSIR